jgi:hypothetical protein
MSFIKKITEKISFFARKAYVEKIARELTEYPLLGNSEGNEQWLQEKFSQTKYKVGNLYKIEINRLGELLSFEKHHYKEIFIFIEEKKEGNLVKQKVFYCPKLNEYLNLNQNNCFCYNIKEIQD